MKRLAAVLVALLLAAPAARAADGKPRRVALVIGAGAYAAVPALPNPPRDAAAIAAALRRLGFDTALVQDPDRTTMERAIRDLGKRAQNAEAAMVFYAGHALEAGGHNMLVPVSARIETARDLPYETLDLDLLLNELDGRARTILIFLDSCRDNPFQRTLAGGSGRGIATRGLAAPAADVTGTLIAFATAPGRTAADGTGQDSPFTTALLHHIETPGLEVREMLGRVRKEVREASGGEQVPWESSALEGSFYFAPIATPAVAGAAPPPAASGAATPAGMPPQIAEGGHCFVPRQQGRMRVGDGATNTIHMTNNGRGCGFSVWRRIAEHDAYDKLEVSHPPAHGTVRIDDAHRVIYLPQPAYTGADSFTLASTPKGVLSVQVQVYPPPANAARGVSQNR